MSSSRCRFRHPLLLVCLLSAPMPSVAAAPELSFQPHVFETQGHGSFDAEIAFLPVPRRHDQPDGPSMQLRIVRLPSRSPTARAAPIVYLAGGPGGSGVGTARGTRWPVFDAVRAEADVLLLDQRGTGLSERLEPCPHRYHFDPEKPGDAVNDLAGLRATAARCVEHWRAQGVDLDAYNTIDSAHDIEALRVALGVERLSLWGMSYGTHLAMAALRYHGEHIERVVLMGAEGPDDTIKLPLAADALLEQVSMLMPTGAQDTPFDPDLIGSIRRVLDALDQAPAQGQARRLPGSPAITIGRFDAQLAIAAALARTRTIRILPLALSAAERGDYDLIAEIVVMVRGYLGTFNAMPLATDVASGVSPARRALVVQGERAGILGRALNFPFPDLGDGLGIADLGDEFRSPLRSKVPTLFISSSLDGRTPVANAEAAISGFSQANHLILAGAGHDDDLWLSHPQIPSRIADFFAGRAVPDTTLPAAAIEFAVSMSGEL